MTVTTKQILKALACDKLALHKGGGYFYFVYDDAEASNIWLDRTVNVYRLSHMSLDSWIAEGRDFLKEVQTKIESSK